MEKVYIDRRIAGVLTNSVGWWGTSTRIFCSMTSTAIDEVVEVVDDPRDIHHFRGKPVDGYKCSCCQ